MNLDPVTQKNVDLWLKGNYDQETKDEIQRRIKAKDHEGLTNAFYKNLSFGTGGLRGIMGVGSNRINKYTIGSATQGFANYINKNFKGEKSVVIAHDCRINSKKFAALVADVFSANNIKVYFFDGMRPTPELSFAVRHFNAQGGVMLTASHNPKEYNGFKAYGPDGGQLVAPSDKEVMDNVRQITAVDQINFTRNEDLIHVIGEHIDSLYLAELKNLCINPQEVEANADMPIVFSAIHGTGGVLVPTALQQLGFTNVQVVEEQMIEDGNFPTVVYPNPEEEEALTLALKKAEDVSADLVMATDPDADRVGIAARNKDGELKLLNGNQTACLLVDYVLSASVKNNDIKEGDYIVKTIVTSYLIDEIAKSFNIPCFNTLTGFKYIGELISSKQGAGRFLVGGEESYGYLVGEHARDKDAVISCAMIAEMAAYHKSHGRTLFDALALVYKKFGFYQEKLISIKKEGKKGAEEIAQMMDNFRSIPPATLGGSEVILIKDYKSGTAIDRKTGKESKIDLPSSNVLQFYTADGSIVSARPSGTEPKIKFYCSAKSPFKNDLSFQEQQSILEKHIKGVLKDLMTVEAC